MKIIEYIFKENACYFDQDDYYGQAVLNIFDEAQGRSLVEETIENIDETDGLGEGYAKRNPVLLAGIIQAMILDHNTRHLVNTLQVSCAVLLATMQKNHAAMLGELREIRKAVDSREAVKND